MKKLLIIFLSSASHLLANGQAVMELSLAPLFNYTVISSGQSSLQDSLKGMNKGRTTLGFGLRVKVQLKRDWFFQTGILYSRYGARFDRENLQFQDSIYPTIGRVEDLSQGASKNIIYKYNFDYFTIPINFLVKIHHKRNKATLNQYFTFGFENNLLVQHNLKLDLVGFDYNGEDRFTINETYWNPAKYLPALNVGARFEIKLNNQAKFSVQPEFRMPLMKSTIGDPKITVGSLNIWSGLTYNFN
jgi:hypothetical protein